MAFDQKSLLTNPTLYRVVESFVLFFTHICFKIFLIDFALFSFPKATLLIANRFTQNGPK